MTLKAHKMEKIFDEAISKFAEGISDKFPGVPTLEVILVHKWGRTIDDSVLEVDGRILVIDRQTGRPYAEVTPEWDVSFLDD